LPFTIFGKSSLIYNISRQHYHNNCNLVNKSELKIPQERVDLKNLISTIKIVNIWTPYLCIHPQGLG
jgi:hypothetical protein